MCNYKAKYKDDEYKCPYPSLYKEFKTIFPETDFEISLPIDSNEYCIFHSQNIEWKDVNNFNKKFSELLQLLDLFKSTKNINNFSYQFIGFVFIGTDTQIERRNKKKETVKAFVLKDLHCSKIDFSNSVFINDTYFENIIFDGYVNFDNSVFKGICDFKKINFKQQSSFCNSVFENTFYCEQTEFVNASMFMNSIFNKYFTLEKSQFGHFVDFSNVRFNSLAKFNKIFFGSQVKFSKAIFSGLVNFYDIEFNSIADFFETEFVFSEDNSFVSSVDFQKINITENGLLHFRGENPQSEMFKGDAQFTFIENIKGKVRFENLNFNKIVPFSKLKLLELEKLGTVEIGKGCRKYYCQTEIFNIETSASNQDLILDIVKVFCNYFKIEQGFNLGLEITERTNTEIHYFYFTDEVISEVEFTNRIRHNETDLWDTLINLTEKAQNAISSDNIGLIDCFLDLNNWWKKIGVRIVKNQLNPVDLTKVVNSISLDKSSEDFIVKSFEKINDRFNLYIQGSLFIQNIDMRNVIELKDVNNTTIYQNVSNSDIKNI